MRSSGKLVTDEDMRANKIRGPECFEWSFFSCAGVKKHDRYLIVSLRNEYSCRAILDYSHHFPH